MKKVGIITFHATTNFGATLQCYSLYQFITKQGFEVEVIDYQPPKLTWEYRKHKYLTRGIFPNKNIIKNVVKSQKMAKFRSSNIKLSSRCYSNIEELKKYCDNYDIIVCGSDEIWNIDSKFTGFDRAYFLDFVESEKTLKIGYAPSFGSVQSLGKRQKDVQELLKGFKYILVRDGNSIKLVEECNLSAQKVLDPTFLGNYEKNIKLPDTPEKYILVYGFLSPKESDHVKAMAEQAKLEIISIGENWKYSPKPTLIGVSPETWLGYFSKATYVFTNFYHGSIFSILFRKPFTVFVRPEKSVKVVDLLTELDLTNRIVDGENLPKDSIFNTKIDFNEDKISEMTQKSKKYLLQALGVDENAK